MVGASVGEDVGAAVGGSVGASVGEPVGASVGEGVDATGVGDGAMDATGASEGRSEKASLLPAGERPKASLLDDSTQIRVKKVEALTIMW